MGGSSSKSSQTITNNTVNQNYMNTLNKTIMNSAVETMINNASSCSSAINVNNSCDMSGADIGGNFTFGGNQTAQAKVNFNCIQANQTSADMATSMMASMVAEMKALNGTDAAANLNTASQSSNTTGFLSMPSGKSSSSSSTNVTNNVTNETISDVQNIFEQNLKNNFSVNTVNKCIGKTNVSNSQDLSNIKVGGDAKVECIQTASVEQVQNCKQLSDAVSKTTQATFQELGMTIATESDTTSKTESTVSSTAENISTGPIQELGTALTGIMGAFGLAFLGPILGPICSICSCIIVVILLITIFKAMVSGGGMDSISSMGNMASGISEMPKMGNMTSGISEMPKMGNMASGISGMPGELSDIFSTTNMY